MQRTEEARDRAYSYYVCVNSVSEHQGCRRIVRNEFAGKCCTPTVPHTRKAEMKLKTFPQCWWKRISLPRSSLSFYAHRLASLCKRRLHTCDACSYCKCHLPTVGYILGPILTS